jgi:hypothetical protein
MSLQAESISTLSFEGARASNSILSKVSDCTGLVVSEIGALLLVSHLFKFIGNYGEFLT